MVGVEQGQGRRTARAGQGRDPDGPLPLFREDGIDPLSLKGATVRLRGWVRFDARPMIDLTHPEQIELLSRP